MKLELQNLWYPEGAPTPGEALRAPPPADVSNNAPPHTPASLLHPLRSLQSPSLITSAYRMSVGGTRYEFTKFLVLGKRSGGTPIRLSLFGGLDAGRIETVAAAAKLLTLLTLGPLLAEDYAVFGYPCVDPAGFAGDSALVSAHKPLAERWKNSPEAHDALFFHAEFQRVAPNGIIHLRSTGESNFLRAKVNSALIAEEVVKPGLLRLRNLVPVEENPVQVSPTDSAIKGQQFREGRLIPHPETQPWPFEIELLAPAEASLEMRVQVLVLASLDILRSYRAFSCHGGEL